LETLGEVWTGFIDNLVKHKNDWKTWYDLEAPENAEIPCGYTEKLSKYQVLMLMRVIRPDRVVNSIKNFIIDKMNDYYVKSPPISYEKIYAQSTCFTPIVFILSPGADPFSDVQKLVETIGLGMNKFRFLALGQGMGDQAK
jgi:dynein heavy chain